MPQCALMAGTLYIVATPIGNLDDTTQRALRVLSEVDLIACEDTRHTRVLLNRFGIKTKTISYHEHNERDRADQLGKLLAAGKSVAIVSDAGTPLISDPGFRLVTLAIKEGCAVVPVPGASAVISALVASGLPSDQFFFAGFLPARAQARRARLQGLRTLSATLVFYEAPHRIAATLQDSLDLLGNRQAAVARELTKIHEEISRGSLSELAGSFTEDKARGEMVLIIAGKSDETVPPADRNLAVRVKQLEQDGLDSKAALRQAAREFGLKRAEAYRMLIAQKNLRRK